MKLLDDGRDIMLITNEGILIRMGVDDISVIGRNTSGVKLMSIEADSDVRVASIAKVRESSRQDEEENVEDPENPDSRAVYYDADGNEITLNQGRTWVCIIQDSYEDNIVIE